MTMSICDHSVWPGYLPSILKLDEADPKEVERIERGKRDYDNRLRELLDKEGREKREKIARNQ